MTDTVKAFIERVDRLEARYQLKDNRIPGDRYYAMPRDEMLALRDELTESFPCPYCGKRVSCGDKPA